jgi:transcription elongation factor Elf1
MDAVQPRVRVERRSYAPKTFPCPHCGRKGRRKATHHRRVRDIAYGEIVTLEIEVGEYRARCSCCKTFRAQVPGVEARATYTNRVRQAVLDRLVDDRMSMERLREGMQRDFHLDLSQGFLYDCLDWKVRQVDLPAYRQWTLEHFSGTLCIDEIHLGHRTLLLATDPLSDFPVAFALVSANDHEHMRRFLQNLKQWGFLPQVVVSDGSNLYPKLLAGVWPQARHQLCIFHVLKDINTCILDAVRRLRRQHAAKAAGRKRRRGRPSRSQQRARARQGKTKKEQAYFIWKHRHLLVTRPENLSGRQRRWLSHMFQHVPALRCLRAFVLEVYGLFDPSRGLRQIVTRWANLVENPAYLANPDLVRALQMLSPEKFEKMIAYLESPLGQRVRTNNHVERTNRRLRYLEKVRYKWRRRRTIVRFVVLAFDRWRQKQGTDSRTETTQATRSPKTNLVKPGKNSP